MAGLSRERTVCMARRNVRRTCPIHTSGYVGRQSQSTREVLRTVLGWSRQGEEDGSSMNGRQLQFRTPQNFYADINLNRRIADREGIDDVVVIAHFGGHYD